MMDDFAAFTLKSTSLLYRIVTDVRINSNKRYSTEPIDTNKTWRALWDTGASSSIIDRTTAKILCLEPQGIHTLATANGTNRFCEYIIDLDLTNNVKIANLVVGGGDLGNNIDFLIGMDIISQGDFSISNVNGCTTFSFRIPSVKEIDYVKEVNDTNRCLSSEDK